MAKCQGICISICFVSFDRWLPDNVRGTSQLADASSEFLENPGRKGYKKPALWLSPGLLENPGRKVYKKPAMWLSPEFLENPGRKVYKKPALWLSLEFLENPGRKWMRSLHCVSRIPWKSRQESGFVFFSKDYVCDFGCVSKKECRLFKWRPLDK